MLFAGLNCLAQTNSATTNSASSTPDQVTASQEQAINKAMPEYFEFDKDPVNDTITISLHEYDVLNGDSGDSVKMDVVAFVQPPKLFTDKISLHFISQSSDWKYLDDHDFTIRFDDKKLSPDEDYSNKVLDEGGVYESVFPDFTLQQFHDIAWSDSVYVKLGFENFEIPYADRQKWKLLWKYFDMKKNQAEADLNKAVQ